VTNIKRRNFLKAGGALALAGLAAGARESWAFPESAPSTVRLMGDGLGLTPREYTDQLTRLVQAEDLVADVYATGGVIERLEEVFARILGKEAAVFLPTGTLANHVAVRRLAAGRQRVIVQADSHLYNDAGDCAQDLSGLTLAPVHGDFNRASIQAVLDRTAAGRVKTEVGAISLETPLRRGFNSTHALNDVADIADLAHRQGLGLHLDGARLFMQAAHFGESPADYAAHCDTVYISLYKNFNAAGGAILAGEASTLADLRHERRMFGGSPAHVWPMAAVALLHVEDFASGYQAGREVAVTLRAKLQGDWRFNFETVPRGSNSFWLRLDGVDPATLVRNLAAQDIHLIPPRPEWEGLLLMVNPTWARTTAGALAEAFQAAAGT